MVAAMVAATAVAGNGGAQTLRRPVCPEQKREDQVQRCEGFFSMLRATLLSSTAARRHDAQKAASSHPQQPIPPRHGNPWNREAGKSQTAAGGGQSHRKKAPTKPANRRKGGGRGCRCSGALRITTIL